MATRKSKKADAPTEAQVLAAEPPKPNAATREADKLEEGQHVFRVDLGQALPTPPIRTATDNESKKK
jgi:hypothetical protein